MDLEWDTLLQSGLGSKSLRRPGREGGKMRKDQWGKSLQKARLEIGGWLRTSEWRGVKGQDKKQLIKEVKKQRNPYLYLLYHLNVLPPKI